MPAAKVVANLRVDPARIRQHVLGGGDNTGEEPRAVDVIACGLGINRYPWGDRKRQPARANNPGTNYPIP
jgi:hypothetical protein